MPSLSRIPIKLEVEGKGHMDAELIRHLAPSTVSEILRRLPLSGKVVWFEDSFLYIVTGMTLGAEKQRTKFKRGELAFLVLNGGLGVFLKDVKGMPMNPIGRLKSDISLLKNIEPGDTITFKK